MQVNGGVVFDPKGWRLHSVCGRGELQNGLCVLKPKQQEKELITLVARARISSASKAMWRAIARNSKCHHLHFHRCRLSSSLALSAASSPRDSSSAAAAARLSQGASWFCDHFFNGEHTFSSYQDSVFTIDSVLCSLPVLTNHMKQSAPSGFLSSSSSPSNRGACLQDSFRFSKAFGSSSQAVETLEADTPAFENQEEEILPTKTLTLSSEALAKTLIAETLAPEALASKNLAKTSPEEILRVENLSTAVGAETLSADTQDFVFREPVQTAESGEPGVSERVTEEAAAAKEAAAALRRHTQKMRRRQRKMEMGACWKATLEYKDMVVRMCKKKLAPNVPFVRGLLLSWFEPYRDAILAEQRAIVDKEPLPDRCIYGPYLLQLPPDILAVVVMHKLMAVLMKEQEQGYARLLTVASSIGEAVEQEVEIFRIMNKGKKKKRKRGEEAPNVEDAALQMNIEKMIKRQNVRLLGKTVNRERVSKPWGSPVQVKVGSRLIDILMNVAYIYPPASQSPTHDPPEVRPALKHELKTLIGKKRRFTRQIGVLTCDPLVWSSLEKSAKFVEMPYMPMLVEPVKWTSYKKGGYMVLRSRLMRTHGARTQQFAVARTPKAKLRAVFEALNILGRTPWRINVRVHDVVEKIWADGGCLGNLVDRKNVELHAKPDTKDEQEIKKWKKELHKNRRINSERHSQRCDVELKLSVARKYRKESKFYYPHNLDFRGRAYPMHPHLNHLGSDLCRGLLEFGEGRPLGRTGLRWLKIHLANVFAAGGVDKLSFDGRIAFVDDNIDDILDSAVQPLEGKRWWLKAEDPFQCLAACMSLRDALESNDVENFICHTPVQQDGSCNGLQHYAALGRDVAGAASVNLVAGEKPCDVYSGIADRVRKIMEIDALKDPSVFRDAEFARALVGHVDRKLVKQTVMTSVYGVTFIGARAQILSRLEERGKENDNNQLFFASTYAAKTTLEALGEMFKEAKGIMNWLAECAKLVASENEAVKWSSPLGLPIVQPYRKPGWKQVKTSLQTFSLRNDNDQPVFVQRQKTAFPPNFVHSLDSTHMMMTALACGEVGLCFAGVHDSFWTHASDVDKMNQILRVKFVELYGQPVLENLLKSFRKSFPGVEFPSVPDRGDFQLEEVLKAPYFFN